MGVFEFIVCAGQWDLSQNLCFPRICYLQSERDSWANFDYFYCSSQWISQVSELRKKVSLMTQIALGRWPVDIFQQTTGREVALWIVFTVQGWHGLTFYFYPIWITSWDLPSYPPCREPRATKSLILASSISHILTREEALTIRISCTGSEWKDEGRHAGQLLSSAVPSSMTPLGGMVVPTSSCMIQDTSVKFEDPKE